jgi:hypothetical protein
VALSFRRFDSHWLAQLGTVELSVEAQDGEVQPIQLELAEMVAARVEFYASLAADYLDRFVDRRKACGDAAQEWWLDQIDVARSEEGKAPVFSLSYSLDGDDGGWWTVKVRSFDHSSNPLEKGQIPFAFSRDQG